MVQSVRLGEADLRHALDAGESVSVTTRSLPRASLVTLSLLSLSALAAPAECAEPLASAAQCTSAYENAQLLRQRGKLLSAREEANLCARDQCPEIARRDCARWTEELGREIPSAVVVVRDDADHDIPSQRLLVDGALRPEISSGRPVELDPGTHIFRVERANGPPFERTVTVYQGERDRVLRITAPGPAVQPLPGTAPSVPLRASAHNDRPSYAPAIVVSSFSIVSFAVSGYLGLTGRQELSGLRTSCAPTCTDAQVDPVRTRLTLSDVALGIGLAGAALAVYLFVRTASERAAAPSVALVVTPAGEGATASMIGRF